MTSTQPNQSADLRVVMLGVSVVEKGGVAALERLIINTPVHGARIRHISTSGGGWQLLKACAAVRGIGTFAWMCVCSNVDIAHLHLSAKGSLFRKVAAALIAQATRTAYVVHVHSGHLPAFFARLPKRLQRMVVAALSRCEHMIVLSSDLIPIYAELFHVPPERISALPNPVHIPADVPVRRPRTPLTIVFLGAYAPAKGIFDLVDALAALPVGIRASVKVVMAGSGDSRQLLARIQRLGIESHFEVKGWVDSTERDRLLCGSDVFVLPSYAEGMPMALLEAMAWGVAPIATSVGGIPSMIDHDREGLLFVPGDVPSLTRAISRLVESSELRAAFGQAARRRAKTYALPRYAERLGAIYKEAICCVR